MTSKEIHTDGVANWKVKDLVFRVDGADPGDFISYDEERCNGCGDCALVCAANLWAVREGEKARLTPKYPGLCLECAACYAVCEQDAIDFDYPAGGTGIVIKHG